MGHKIMSRLCLLLEENILSQGLATLEKRETVNKAFCHMERDFNHSAICAPIITVFFSCLRLFLLIPTKPQFSLIHQSPFKLWMMMMMMKHIFSS